MDNGIYQYDKNYNENNNEDTQKIYYEYNTYFLEFIFFTFIVGSISYHIYMICSDSSDSSKNLQEILLIEDSNDQCSICLDNYFKNEKKK